MMRRGAAALLLAIGTSTAAAPPSRADDALVERGKLVFNIGGCRGCHTAKDGPELAGGDPIVTPYGTFHAPNITPDPETGIGGWTEADLERALRQGRGKEGEPLYPAFPYTSYTRLTDEDVHALKAYLDTVPPVKKTSPAHELSFPYSQRWGLYAWQWWYFQPARFRPDPGKDAAWNRGAYLAEGPGHCQECHTPRTLAGALDETRAYAGAPNPSGKGSIPNITQDPDKGLGKWDEDAIQSALKIGMLPNGDFVGGQMAEIVKNGTSQLPDGDLAALVGYVKGLAPR